MSRANKANTHISAAVAIDVTGIPMQSTIAVQASSLNLYI